MEIIRVENYEEMSTRSCEIFVKRLKSIEFPVFGLATGSTPMGLYRCLVKKFQAGEISFKYATTFNLDEYIGLPKDHEQSYHYYMNELFFRHIDILKENAHVPNGMAEDLHAECEQYERLIEESGGIDLQILGIGENGHIAFNEPGSPFNGKTAVVNLSESTLKANARFFKNLYEVPTRAISMGIGTIMKAKEIILLASGGTKAVAMKKIIHGEITEDVPASILQKHKHVTIIADEAALSKV